MNAATPELAQHHAGQQRSNDQLLDIAIRLYWHNRPKYGRACGSIHGYWRHLDQNTQPCPECKNARRLIVAINRHRTKQAA